jgi:hypothetical protein
MGAGAVGLLALKAVKGIVPCLTGKCNLPKPIALFKRENDFAIMRYLGGVV